MSSDTLFSRLAAQIGRARRAPEQIRPHLLFKANALPAHFDRRGRSWPPRRIFLGVNSVCGERCLMCDFGQKATERMFYRNLRPTDAPVELPLPRLKALIDEVAPFRPILEAHTVEPTLYRPLPELAAYAASRGLPFRVFTSGARLAAMADDLVAAGVDQIYVSLDGPPAVHDAIRGVPGAFARAVRGITAVQAARRRHPDSRTKIRVNATISNHNYAHLVELVETVQHLDPFCIMFMHLNFVTAEMAATHNARFGHVCQATPLGIGGVDPAQVDTHVLFVQLQTLTRRFPAHQILIQPAVTTAAELHTYYHQPQRFLRSQRFLRGQRCAMPWRTVMIMPDGGVIVRNRCYHVVFGNILTQPLLAIWNNPAFRQFRQALQQAGTFPACARCYGAFE